MSRRRWSVLPVGVLAVVVAVALAIVACSESAPVAGVPDGALPPGGDAPPGSETPTLAAPTDVTAEPLREGIRVTWRHVGDAHASTLVLRALVTFSRDAWYVDTFQVIATLDADAERYDDLEVMPGSAYRYAIAVRGAGGTSAMTEHTGEAVTPGDEAPPSGPVTIEAFAVTPSFGTGPTDVLFTWRLGPAEAAVACRLAFGDGDSVVVDPCPSEGERVHTFDLADAAVLEAALTTIHGPFTQRAVRGVALNLNPDEERLVVLVARQDDGLAVRGLGGLADVNVVAIDRHGDATLLTGRLDEFGSAVVAEYQPDAEDRTPYTLYAAFLLQEAYGSLITRIDDVRGGGTWYLDAEGDDLARITLRPEAAGDEAWYAYVVFEDAPEAATPLVPPEACCAVLERERVVHVLPGSYSWILHGSLADGTAYRLRDRIDIVADGEYRFDPARLPSGAVALPLAASFDARSVCLERMSGGRLTGQLLCLDGERALLEPGAYGGWAEVAAAGWRAQFYLTMREVAEDDTATWLLDRVTEHGLDIGGVPAAGATITLRIGGRDIEGNAIGHVTRDGADVGAIVRVEDPRGTLVFEGDTAAPEPDGWTLVNAIDLTLPATAEAGTYRVAYEWDLGPFADDVLRGETSFVIAE